MMREQKKKMEQMIDKYLKDEDNDFYMHEQKELVGFKDYEGQIRVPKEDDGLEGSDEEYNDYDNEYLSKKVKTMKLSVVEFRRILKMHQKEEKVKKFNEMGLRERLVYMFTAPLDKLSQLCIPPVEEDKLDSKLLPLYPITSLLSILLLNDCKPCLIV